MALKLGFARLDAENSCLVESTTLALPVGYNKKNSLGYRQKKQRSFF